MKTTKNWIIKYTVLSRIIYLSDISSKFINKFVEKCQCNYSLSDQSIPLITVTSVVSLLIEQLCLEYEKRPKLKENINWPEKLCFFRNGFGIHWMPTHWTSGFYKFLLLYYGHIFGQRQIRGNKKQGNFHLKTIHYKMRAWIFALHQSNTFVRI